MEEVQDKYLQPVLEVLDSKNIKGVKLLRQNNKIMLIFDKSKLNKTNLPIMNSMTMVYPNDIVCINDQYNPFDYDEIYKNQPTKPNIKVRPYDVYAFGEISKRNPKEYFEQYPFAGIELDTTRLDSIMQLGYFLEFVNALQEQNPLEGENKEVKKGIEVYSADQLRRYEHYTRQGQPDLRTIRLLVEYNESIKEVNTELELKNDPYFYRISMETINEERSDINIKEVEVIITPERLLNNVYQYVEQKKQEKSSENKNQIPLKPKLLEEIEHLID